MLGGVLLPLSRAAIAARYCSNSRSVPQAASILNVSEETVRRNIRSKRLVALRRGTQWFVQHAVLVRFAKNYDPKTGNIKEE